jgi:hypothetical protein
VSKKLTAQQIQDQINKQGRSIVLDQSTYVNTRTKAKFIDPEYGEWWATPYNVVHKISNHPKRGLANKAQYQKLTPQQIQERLDKDGRGIILDQSTYINTGTKARFIDPEFGEWWAKPNKVLMGSGHPKKGVLSRSKKLTLSPQQIQERLDKDGRGIILDQSTYVKIQTKARFIDPEYGEWWATPHSVLNGRGHPKRSLANRIHKRRLSADEVQERLDKQGNGVVLDKSTYVNTHTKARFIDPEFGEWWALPYNVFQGKGHPKQKIETLKQKFTMSPDKIQERIDKNGRGIVLDKTTYINTKTKARFIDPEFGEWWTIPNEAMRGSQHPKRIFKQNKIETFVAEQLGVEWIGDTKLEGFKYKPDFKLNERVYLNVDGLYWHTEEYRGRVYHFEMREWFESRGMRILQFRENEIRDKWEIVKGIIDAVMGRVENRVGARECEIVRMDAKECYDFYEKWHLKGGIKVGGYGLKYSGEVVAVISTKKIGDIVKVERFCVKAGWSVSGGYSKLLNRAMKDYEGIAKIQSWVDLRYGDGHSLERMGFVRVKDTLGWEWTDGADTYNRLRCRANMDERGLSEKEHAEELGWVRIYDAGQRLFEKVADQARDKPRCSGRGGCQ